MAPFARGLVIGLGLIDVPHAHSLVFIMGRATCGKTDGFAPKREDSETAPSKQFTPLPARRPLGPAQTC
ncbi:hypothetical protein NK6_1465 [Bradyrhizobium diazoefficiens]|uniref:Uncharacterized protein n=1 Tax=Bradyrhizobium diazoefficiens TaxID=1355477 RepID=A0A0E4FVL5_9BRAD|nr:hypothetical protein NK6_1465 [Bradyrhizobium diazoefficiens]